MAGLFNTLYKLRSKSEREKREDYLTEIFAYCLREDTGLLKAFLKKFKISQSELVGDYKVETQKRFVKLKKYNHSSDSVPDIVITTDDTVIFFENKINSPESFEQLKRYTEQLNNRGEVNKILIYITKHYDPKIEGDIIGQLDNEIKFIPIRWYELCNFLGNQEPFSNLLTNELLIYMKETGLSMKTKFDNSEIKLLSSFSNTIAKLDDPIKIATTNSKASFKFSLQKTKFFGNNRYAYQATMRKGFIISVGYWFSENTYPDLQVEIALNHKEFEGEQLNIIDEKLKAKQGPLGSNTWTYYPELEGWSRLAARKSLENFIVGENHLKKIQDYFEAELQNAKKVLDEIHSLLKKPDEA